MKAINLQKSDSKNDALVYRSSKEKTFDFRWSEVKISGKNITNRSNHIAIFFDAKMYVHGGYDADKGILSDFHSIDLTHTNQDFEWTKLNNMVDGEPIRLKGHTAVIYKTNIILFGGERGLGENSNSVYIYDIVSQTWKKPKIIGQDLVCKVDSHCTAMIGENMYVYGGYVADRASMNKDIYSLNLQKMQWSIVYSSANSGHDIQPIGRSSSAMVAYHDGLYVFGGTDGQKTLNDMWRFNTKIFKWQKIQCDAAPEPRRGHSMVVYKEFLFLFGGIQDVTKEKNDMYIFEFDKNKWNKIHTFTNSIYDCSPTLKREKRDGSKSPQKIAVHRLSPQKNSQNGDVMKKILAQNKQKKFMEKKKELLKQFSEKPENINKKRSFSPTTESMLKTLESIGNQESNKNEFQHQIIYDESRRFIIGKKPCARDGQTVAVWQNKMYIFGGDRHLMSFNDIYEFDLDKGIKSLQLYRTK